MDSSEISFGLFERGENKNVPTHLESVAYQLRFHNLLVDCKSIQKFTNRSEKPVELLYKYRSTFSPHEMSVSLFDPETGKREKLIAEVHTKEKAIEKYDDAISESNRAVLMEKDEETENLYILSLGNIKPRMEIEITTETVYTATLETDEDKPDVVNFLHTIPAMVPDDLDTSEEMEKNVSITIFVEGARTLSCPSHPHALTNAGDGKWMTEQPLSVDEDIDIEVMYERYPFSTFLTAPINYKNYKYAGILSLLPNFPASHQQNQPEQQKELILIVDCSGSMSGSRMRCAVETIRLFIQSLDADRNLKYNIIRFGSRFESLFPTSVPLRDDENFEKAKQYVQNMRSDLGGTNMFEPIKSIFSNSDHTSSTTTTNKQLFLFTDGEDSYPKEIEKYLKEMNTKVGLRVFSFGIGRGINRSFLQNCADLTKGSACFIEDTLNAEKMKNHVLKQLSNAFRTSIAEIEIMSNGFLQSDGVKRASSSLMSSIMMFNGRSHHEYFFMEKLPEPDTIEVRYAIQGEEKTEKVEMIIMENFSSVGVKVANQMMKMNPGWKREEMEGIGLQFHIPTKFTSFVMVSEFSPEEEDEEERKIVSEMVVEQVRFSRKKQQQKKKKSGYDGQQQQQQELGSLQDEMDELMELMNDMNDLVQDQNTKIDHIEDNVSMASVSVQKGRKNISKAAKKSKSGGGGGGWFSGWFGGGKKKKKKKKNEKRMDQLIERNRKKIDVLQKREVLIQTRISKEKEKAKEYMKKGNKGMAKQALVRSKHMEKQIMEINNQVMMTEQQNMQLEEQAINMEVMNAQKSMVSNLRSVGNIDSVMDTLDDVRECMADSNELSQALGDVMEEEEDDDILMDELESLESEVLDGELASMEQLQPVIPKVSVINIKQEEEPKETKNVKGSVSLQNMNQLLLESDMRGCWELNLKNLRCIGYPSKTMFLEDTTVEKMKNLGCSENEWFTAVVVAVLERFYKKKKNQWKMIVRKSMKVIREEVIQQARLFVKKL